jgi:hypothetical protein
LEKYDEGECLFPSQGRGRQFMILKAEQIIERTGRNFPSEKDTRRSPGKIPLKSVKGHKFSVELAEYAMANQVEEEPASTWWAHS